MSKTVWSTTKGWRDGAEVQVSSVAALDDRHDLQFISDSQECSEIRFDFGPAWDGLEYDSYFVKVADGEYQEIWGMCGIVPYNTNMLTRLV